MTKSKTGARDLSRREPTDEEIEELRDAIGKSHPIVTAVLGQAMVEYDLEKLLRSRFKTATRAKWAEMVGDQGPFATFGQKIIAGYGFGLYDEATKRHLNTIRNIRNAFAHAKFIVTFDRPEIIAELRAVTIPTAKSSRRYKAAQIVRSTDTAPADAYLILCYSVGSTLTKRLTTHHKRAIANMGRAKKARERDNPFLTALAVSPPRGLFGRANWRAMTGGLPPGYLGVLGGGLLETGSDDPTTQALALAQAIQGLGAVGGPPKSEPEE